MSRKGYDIAAFPIVAFQSPYGVPEPGMSLRDWFAGQALMAIISKAPYKSGTAADMDDSGDAKARAGAAYAYADAMIAERDK